MRRERGGGTGDEGMRAREMRRERGGGMRDERVRV